MSALDEHGPGHAAARPFRDRADRAARLVARRAARPAPGCCIRSWRCGRRRSAGHDHLPGRTCAASRSPPPRRCCRRCRWPSRWAPRSPLAKTVGWRRWAAIAVGFTGVLIIVRPGNGRLQRLCAAGARLGRLLHRARPCDQAHSGIDPLAAGFDRHRGAGDGLRRLPGRADGRLEPGVERSRSACWRPRPCCCSSAISSSSWRCAPAKSPSSRRSATPRCCGRSCSVSWCSATFPTGR